MTDQFFKDLGHEWIMLGRNAKYILILLFGRKILENNLLPLFYCWIYKIEFWYKRVHHCIPNSSTWYKSTQKYWPSFFAFLLQINLIAGQISKMFMAWQPGKLFVFLAMFLEIPKRPWNSNGFSIQAQNGILNSRTVLWVSPVQNEGGPEPIFNIRQR